eukprot:7621560-Heterocapsa_arctica.AAC.1
MDSRKPHTVEQTYAVQTSKNTIKLTKPYWQEKKGCSRDPWRKKQYRRHTGVGNSSNSRMSNRRNRLYKGAQGDAVRHKNNKKGPYWQNTYTLTKNTDCSNNDYNGFNRAGRYYYIISLSNLARKGVEVHRSEAKSHERAAVGQRSKGQGLGGISSRTARGTRSG